MGVWAQRSEKESNLRNLMLSHKRSTAELSLLVGPPHLSGVCHSRGAWTAYAILPQSGRASNTLVKLPAILRVGSAGVRVVGRGGRAPRHRSALAAARGAAVVGCSAASAALGRSALVLVAFRDRSHGDFLTLLVHCGLLDRCNIKLFSCICQ